MANDNLETYLNDHLAGSVAAIELLSYLEEEHAGTPIGRFAAELRAEVAADRGELEALMRRLQIMQSRPRKATAWLAEKITQIKLRVDDPTGGALRRLQALEVIALGIEGKRALWSALEAAAEAATELQGLDYERLTRRAEEQRGKVEVMRQAAAKEALAGSS
jgi:hypothetical protein